jgi:hypothetical protein
MTARVDIPDLTMHAIQCGAKALRDVGVLHGNPDAIYHGLLEVLEDEGKLISSVGARAYLRAIAKLLEARKP